MAPCIEIEQSAGGGGWNYRHIDNGVNLFRDVNGEPAKITTAEDSLTIENEAGTRQAQAVVTDRKGFLSPCQALVVVDKDTIENLGYEAARGTFRSDVPEILDKILKKKLREAGLNGAKVNPTERVIGFALDVLMS